MNIELDINNNHRAGKTVPNSHAVMFRRRSLSVADTSALYYKMKDPKLEFCDAEEDIQKSKLRRQMSLQRPCLSQVSERPAIERQPSINSDTLTSPYELSNENNIGPLASVYFESYFDVYVRFVIFPIVFIFFIIYTFFHLPVAPKAEIYRSLSATFVLMVGIMVQCCCLTIWASHRYGFNELVAFLRYCITMPQSR